MNAKLTIKNVRKIALHYRNCSGHSSCNKVKDAEQRLKTLDQRVEVTVEHAIITHGFISRGSESAIIIIAIIASVINISPSTSSHSSAPMSSDASRTSSSTSTSSAIRISSASAANPAIRSATSSGQKKNQNQIKTQRFIGDCSSHFDRNKFILHFLNFGGPFETYTLVAVSCRILAWLVCLAILGINGCLCLS